MREHVHNFVVMRKGRSIGKSIRVLYSEFLDICPEPVSIDSCLTRIESEKTYWNTISDEFPYTIVDSEESFFYLTVFSSMNRDKDEFFSSHVWILVKGF